VAENPPAGRPGSSALGTLIPGRPGKSVSATLIRRGGRGCASRPGKPAIGLL